MQRMWSRYVAVFAWSMLTWTLLSWTATVEQILFGVLLSAAVAGVCLSLGPMAGPWLVLSPRRFVALCRLAVVVAVRVVSANLRLGRLAWSAHAAPPSGMVIVPTQARGDGALAAVAVLTSVVVDSQLVDLDRRRHELQYHAVWAETGREANYRRINEPVEARLEGVAK